MCVCVCFRLGVAASGPWRRPNRLCVNARARARTHTHTHRVGAVASPPSAVRACVCAFCGQRAGAAAAAQEGAPAGRRTARRRDGPPDEPPSLVASDTRLRGSSESGDSLRGSSESDSDEGSLLGPSVGSCGGLPAGRDGPPPDSDTRLGHETRTRDSDTLTAAADSPPQGWTAGGGGGGEMGDGAGTAAGRGDADGGRSRRLG